MMPLGNRFSFFANVVLNVSASFLGCSHNREQSPVKWGDFLSIHPSVYLPVQTSIHMSPPARPPGLQASQDFQLASQASEPASKAFQLASQASEHQDSSFWAVAPIGDEVLKNGEIFRSFVHLFVCLFVCSFFGLLICSIVNRFSFVRLFVRSTLSYDVSMFIRLFVCSSFSYVHHLLISLFLPSFVRPIVCLFVP